MEVEEIDLKQAVEILSGRHWPTKETTPKKRDKKADRSTWPDFEKGTEAELQALSELRRINIQGLRLATNDGFLRFADYQGHRCWISTDYVRVAASARRLDGGTLDTPNGPAKAKDLYGSEKANHPLNVRDVGDWPVLICEGAPDALTLYHYIAEAHNMRFCIWCFLGGSSGRNLPEKVLRCLKPGPATKFRPAREKARRVRVYEDTGEAGKVAAERWAEQCANAGCETDIFDFEGLRKEDGSLVTDLNDTRWIHPDDRHQLEGLLP
ncbi:MAG: hypothetical protein AAF514_06000 [Verrucomicrobiota bacterium]